MIRIISVVLATLAVGIVSADRSAKAFAQHRSARASALLQSAQAARPAQQTVAPADLVLRNGTIVTVDEGKPEAQALAARGDTIVAVGSNQDIQPYIGASTKVIDLKGALATPGFIDAHVHFTGVGDAAKNLKLATAKNWDEIVRMVGEAAQKAKPGEWILGRGWHQEKWSETPSPNVEGFPLHDALSKAAPNNPVWLTHASGHAGFANALAMKMAEVTKTTADPEGGKILRDRDGNATGLFNERAQSIVAGALARDLATRTPAKVEADLREVIELAGREALAKGLTTVDDAGSPPLTIDVMKKVVDEGKLPLRVWMMLREDARNLAADMPKYRVVNYGDKRFTVRATKRAIDGALGSRGAWMLAPYADLATTSGMTTDNLDDVRMIAELAIEHDYQMAVHAIGDRGNREVLDIYEQTFRKHPEKSSRELRWRIEHAQHVSAADIPRFGRLGVIASMQGIHATSDAVFVLARLGPARAEEGAYVWQKLMKSGATIANGTDAPVEDIDPIPSFYASVSRKVKDGSVFYSDQRMSRMEALRSYTINAAFAGFEETIKGSLRAGKLADITVFSNDLLTVPEDRIPSTRILYTIVGGKVQYQGASTPATSAGRP
ncbi:MAG TPA: amidohydrolase [Vicinamibacterales bacterium]|nr:amidohydrolase [Vicinamibacterales bacterium]